MYLIIRRKEIKLNKKILIEEDDFSYLCLDNKKCEFLSPNMTNPIKNEFGFGKGSSELYGVSFTFHEQQDDIMVELNKLNKRLREIGYTEMIHMADLIMNRKEYIQGKALREEALYILLVVICTEIL